MSQQSPRPRYFHLLWDEDLEDLRQVLTNIRDRRHEVIAHWYELYLLHFGDQRTLTEVDFKNIFEPALLRNQNALLCNDMDGYAGSVLTMGKELAERQMPMEELIAAIQLFEEAAQAVFPQNRPLPTSVYNKFDKLSHIRIILLIGAYTRIRSATAAGRIHALEMEARTLPVHERTLFHGLIGASALMRALYERIETEARGNQPLLIVGEPGVGKELIARAVHRCSSRHGEAFTSLKCTAMPSHLIGNELFGYQRSDAKGARLQYMGLYRSAETGTLFLDELTAMPLNVQQQLTAMVRGAQSNGNRSSPRIIGASTRDLQEAIRVGQMRQEFAQLFSGHPLRVPPLRERGQDIELLAGHFVDLLNQRMARKSAVMGIDDGALEALHRYPWPGNVPELFQAIENAFNHGHSALIGVEDLPDSISGIDTPHRPLPTISFETFADAERGVLKRALEITGGNKVRAAKLLKISRKKLYSGIAKYGIKSAEPPR
jgi:DNA-binding NtrC family response regulator